jgi:hypothetical protein
MDLTWMNRWRPSRRRLPAGRPAAVGRTVSAAVIVVALGVLPASAWGASQQDVADWTAASQSAGATGTLLGQSVSLSGTHVFDVPISRVDGSWPDFAGPDFVPSLAMTDEIQIGATTPAESYRLLFGSPVADPVLYLGSLGSRLDFPAGTQITKISGQSGFTVFGNTVTGAPTDAHGPDGVNDSNGTVQLVGTFQSISFTALYTPGGEDGVILQVAGSAPPAAPPPAPPPPPPTTTTPVPPVLPAAAPPAVAGHTADVTLSGGVVLIKVGTSYVPLTGTTISVPTGSTVDARKGAVTITTAADGLPAGDPRHRVQAGTFSDGIFTVKQLADRDRHQTPATDVLLQTAPHAIAKAHCTRTGPPRKGVVRTLKGIVKGVYRVVAGASTTSVTRGAFTVSDRCDGTLTRVTSGHATITITKGRHRHHLVHLHAGQSYLVRLRLFVAKQLR